MSIYNDHKPEQGDGLYLKLKDGDRVKLRIASEPAGSIYKAGDRLRYSWVVFNRDKERAQVYSAGISVYSQIADLVEEWGEPTDFDIIIKRTGSGMNDTSYSVTPVKSSLDLTKGQLTESEAINLLEAVKGRWLADIEKDGIAPEPTFSESGYDKFQASKDKLKGTFSDGEPLPEEELPEGF